MTGSLLVASPALLDPNFRRTILFLSNHSAEEGAMGLVLNRPLSKTVADVAQGAVGDALLAAPLHYGGPVSQESIIIASLQWRDNPASVAFQSFNTSLQGEAIPPEWQTGLRVYVGYTGWGKGQLEAEIAQKAWFVIPPRKELVVMENPRTAWRDLLRRMDPMLKLLADAPDDPSLN